MTSAATETEFCRDNYEGVCENVFLDDINIKEEVNSIEEHDPLTDNYEEKCKTNSAVVDKFDFIEEEIKIEENTPLWDKCEKVDAANMEEEVEKTMPIERIS